MGRGMPRPYYHCEPKQKNLPSIITTATQNELFFYMEKYE